MAKRPDWKHAIRSQIAATQQRPRQIASQAIPAALNAATPPSPEPRTGVALDPAVVRDLKKIGFVASGLFVLLFGLWASDRQQGWLGSFATQAAASLAAWSTAPLPAPSVTDSGPAVDRPTEVLPTESDGGA